MKYSSLFLFSVLLFASCSQNEKSEGSQDQKPYYFDEIASYGEDQLPEDMLLGTIQDIAIDSDNNLYVLDSGLNHVLKFDAEGNFQRTLANGEGRGPGEFLNPLMLSVDGQGRIYVYDRSMQKVVVMDSENEFITEFTVENMPSRMAVDEDGNIYITNYGVPFPIEGPKVFKYIQNDEGSYELVDRFVRISKEIDTRIRGLAGNTDKMALRSSDTLYFSVWFPYEIRTYTTSGDSLNTLKRDVPFFNEPERLQSGIVDSDGRIAEVLPFKNGLVGARITDSSNPDSLISYIDFWDKTGEFSGSFEESEIGVQQKGRQFITDDGETLYVSYNEPTAHIKKYKLVKK
jgi:hypothetical protein